MTMKIKGRKFTYLQKNCRLPSGKKTRLEMIIHPGAALMVPFVSAKKVIFLRQYRAVIGQYLYELPAGTCDPGETPLACARRELVEETGFQAKCFTRLGKIFPVPGYSTEVIHIYRADGLSPRAGQGDADEILSPVVFTRRQARELFQQGKIPDAKTICALAMCGWV